MTQQLLSLQDVDVQGKTVLIRADLNVPIKDGKVASAMRIEASLPSISYALDNGAGVLVMSHLGRPTEGEIDDRYSLAPVADYLAKRFARVRFCADYLTNSPEVAAGELVVLENVRFNAGEKNNAEQLAKQYANFCDIFVMDAFGTAHRAQASTAGVATQAQAQGKIACAGLLLSEELQALGRALDKPQAPVVAIVGGAKVSTKLEVLQSLANICDSIIVGGGIANTFLAAKGINVGASLYEPALIDTAKDIMEKVTILLPDEVIVTKKSAVDFDNFLPSLAQAPAIRKSVTEINDDELILDSDPSVFVTTLRDAKTILWNGPIGVFEVPAFATGTETLAQAIANSSGYSIAGGGDTLAAVDKYGIADKVDYLSTGGGAFLEFVEGKALPAIVALGATS